MQSLNSHRHKKQSKTQCLCHRHSCQVLVCMCFLSFTIISATISVVCLQVRGAKELPGESGPASVSAGEKRASEQHETVTRGETHSLDFFFFRSLACNSPSKTGLPSQSTCQFIDSIHTIFFFFHNSFVQYCMSSSTLKRNHSRCLSSQGLFLRNPILQSAEVRQTHLTIQ